MEWNITGIYNGINGINGMEWNNIINGMES